MLIDTIKNKLDNDKDPRIQELIKINGSLFWAVLFEPHIKCENDFNFRYISQGRSGAGVILVIPDNKPPFIIKYGEKNIITKEKENYQNEKDFLPQEIIVNLKESYGILSNYASLSYSWAGGWNDTKTFQDYYMEEKSSQKLSMQINFLMDNLFKWYDISKGSCFPFDKWELDLNLIKTKINNWDKDNSSKKKLINSINDQEKWRNFFKLTKFSKGKCHGDMNCHNILIVQNKHLDYPKLIDFASICKEISPAKDWAKVERDIKFRFLRNQFNSDPTSLREIIEKVENACNLQNTKNIEISIEKPCRLISLIRKEYSEKTNNISEAPY